MSKGLIRSQNRATVAQPTTITIPVKDLVLSAAVGTPGWATGVLQGLPKGNVVINSALANLSFSSLIAGAANPNVAATFTGNFAIGTTATADATLTSTDANIVASTAMTTAVASVSALKASTPTALDLVVNNSDSVSGTGTKLIPTGNSASSESIKTGPAIAVNLNISIANVSTAVAAITVNGYVVLTYTVTGNY